MDVSGLGELLFSLHLSLSFLARVPQIGITTDEAERLADAAQRVMRHYNIPAVHQKTLDWVNLIQALGMLYIPRVIAISAESKARAQARAAAMANAPKAKSADAPPPEKPVAVEQPGLPPVVVPQEFQH